MEQRCWRTLTGTKYPLTRDRARLQSQLESLLEEWQIKLSSVVRDLLGASGQRVVRAIAAAETDPAQLRALGDKRLHATDSQLKDALSGQPQPVHRARLTLDLQRLDLIEAPIAELERMIADAMNAHEVAIVRLSELPGLGVDSAQQIMAAIGPSAEVFPSPEPLASWGESVPGARRAPASPTATDQRRAPALCVVD